MDLGIEYNPIVDIKVPIVTRHKVKSMIEVTEIFGPTLQGEGPSIGKPAKFLRLRRCNLECTWCDTKYTWDKNDPGFNEFRTMSYPDIVYEVGVQDLVVITGGEPLIWKRQLKELLNLKPRWKRIEIETNGTIHPEDIGNFDNVFFNVSPKLQNSGNRDLKTLKYAELRSFALHQGSIFKFVVTDKSDLREVEDIVSLYQIPRHKVYIMPEGTDSQKIQNSLRSLFEACAHMGYALTPRLHVLAFGNQRGI